MTFLYGLLAIFGFDDAREDAINATLSTAVPYVLTTGVAITISAFILGVVTHTLARQLGGDGAWQPTVGLSMLIMSITDAPRVIVAMFLGGGETFVQLLGWADLDRGGRAADDDGQRSPTTCRGPRRWARRRSSCSRCCRSSSWARSSDTSATCDGRKGPGGLGPAGAFHVRSGRRARPQASRTCPARLTTGGSTLHGKLIQSSVRFQTYSHFTSECDFS